MENWQAEFPTCGELAKHLLSQLIVQTDALIDGGYRAVSVELLEDEINQYTITAKDEWGILRERLAPHLAALKEKRAAITTSGEMK